MRLGLAGLLLLVIGGLVVTAGAATVFGGVYGCGGRGYPARIHRPAEQVRQEPSVVANRAN